MCHGTETETVKKSRVVWPSDESLVEFLGEAEKDVTKRNRTLTVKPVLKKSDSMIEMPRSSSHANKANQAKLPKLRKWSSRAPKFWSMNDLEALIAGAESAQAASQPIVSDTEASSTAAPEANPSGVLNVVNGQNTQAQSRSCANTFLNWSELQAMQSMQAMQNLSIS
eukprot:929160-Rhodomonas_salina.2